jgi:hypothetical protein
MMRRRDFITLLGGAAVAWASVAAGQSAKKRPVVGMLLQGTPAQVKGMRLRQSFFDGMRELGYIEGRDFDTVARVAETTGDLPRLAPRGEPPAGIGKRHQRRGRASPPEVLLAPCLRDRFANVGFQVSARCLV